MATPHGLDTLRRRHARLAAGLARTGLVAQGTITERTLEREDTQHPGTTKTYGPYYQWTFKDRGKTVTVNLSKGQATRLKRAIENHRRVENVLAEMRDLSRQIIEASTKGVKKRKSNA